MKGVAVVVVFGYAGSQAVDGIVQRLVGRSHPGDVAVGHAEYMAIHRFIRTGIFQIESDVDKHFVSLFGRLVFDCGGVTCEVPVMLLMVPST